MTDNAGGAVKHKSGVRAALEYTGIPPSWFEKRPKLPSRNWLIFLSATSAVTGWYIYDRQQCKRIRQSYIERVQHLAEVPADTFAPPRRVTVLGCKWPGDEEYEQSLKYFRKYVKPILVAAAVDYDMVKCKRQGDLASYVEEQVRKRRRLDAGLDSDPEPMRLLPTYKNPEQRRELELQGGIVVVGRPAFMEFMTGLVRGWNNSLVSIDKEEALARELSSDGHFDEPVEDSVDTVTPSNPLVPLTQSSVLSALQTQLSQASTPSYSPQHSSEHDLDVPVSSIPAFPPIALVPFLNHIGFTQIPYMILDFFNQRHKVRSGAEAAYRIIMSDTRPFRAPLDPGGQAQDTSSDLEFGKETEAYYKSSLSAIPEEIEKARGKYYKELPGRLATAREIARGVREMTSEEQNNPPPTEVELRAERIKKELRWRGDLEGWNLVKPGQTPAWDDKLRGVLRIFTGPSL
jgi:import inner membrane translocase subunit TIM54